MATTHRLTIRTIDPDPRAAAIEQAASDLGIQLGVAISVADIVFVDGDLDDRARRRLHDVLVDPLLQHGQWALPDGHGVEVTFHAGVTDTTADAVRHAAEVLGIAVSAAASGRRIEFGAAVSDDVADLLVRRVVANPVIERWAIGTIEPPSIGAGVAADQVSTIAIATFDDDDLDRLNRDRALSLDPAELRALRDHYGTLGREATDVEIEMFAQTWSEHCAHKTFRAEIELDRDGERRQIVPLLTQLRRCTDEIDAPFVRSAFVGNAGVVELTPGTTVAVKAETHNHPSAVEPFGGANTGVGGVIRDVLGIAHRPIAVTDVLCFGPSDLPPSEVPAGALHPRRIRDGVIDGVADYGNKIGLPTVAGAILYDPAYTTNPLVLAGCIGVAATRALHDGPFPGDRVVVLGGATGRDGIRGATFSSATMDATTGEVAGASVQIGDPVVEKLLIDALIGAEDLYSAITDCGAGGLSSAVGEMAEGVGADVELDLVPRKYPGLAAWEVWLSEAQERMVVAVPADHLDALRARCRRVGVDAADIGAFTGDGRLVVRRSGEIVADVDTGFLHDGRPQRTMTATLAAPDRTPATRVVDDPARTLLALLAHPNIASKAATIHRYDHEILGSTVGRPLVGVAGDGPGDGVVLATPDAAEGMAIGIGVNPWYGLHDPEAMAHAVVDEAIRNVVAVGGDPDRVALLDNFSWGDPRRPSTLGELVAAVEGCCDAARRYGAPFVSGKDSLNNEYTGRDGARHAVPPTLVITAIAHVPDVDACVSSDLAAAGNVLFVVGTTRPEFAGSHLDMVSGTALAEVGSAPQPDTAAPGRYRRLHAAIRSGIVEACHDVSEGGLAVAVAEMCIGGRLGAHIDTLAHADPAAALFGESIGRFVVEVHLDHAAEFAARLADDAHRLGTVTADGLLTLPGVAPIPLAALTAAFHRQDP